MAGLLRRRGTLAGDGARASEPRALDRRAGAGGRPRGPDAARVGAADLHRLDGPGLPDRLDGLAGDLADHVLRSVHADRPGLPPGRPRPAPSRPPRRGRIVLGPQAGPGRREELLQAVLTGIPDRYLPLRIEAMSET